VTRKYVRLIWIYAPKSSCKRHEPRYVHMRYDRYACRKSRLCIRAYRIRYVTRYTSVYSNYNAPDHSLAFIRQTNASLLFRASTGAAARARRISRWSEILSILLISNVLLVSFHLSCGLRSFINIWRKIHTHPHTHTHTHTHKTV